MPDRGILCIFVGYTKYHEVNFYDILHPRIRTIYQICDVTWLKQMYDQKKLDEDNEYLLTLPQEDDNNNYEKYDDAKVDITYTDGN